MKTWMYLYIRDATRSLSLSDVDEGQELLLASVVVLGLFCIFIHIFHIDIQ